VAAAREVTSLSSAVAAHAEAAYLPTPQVRVALCEPEVLAGIAPIVRRHPPL
jgi:hypothetical protein